MKISKKRLKEIVLEEFKLISEADPSMAVQQKIKKGSVVDIYRKAIAALTRWIGARYIPSQKTWRGSNPKAFEWHCKDMFGETRLAGRIFDRASRIPPNEIPSYYSQVEFEKRKQSGQVEKGVQDKI